MHILYLHQYFATPNSATGTRSYEFAKRWVAAGHRVTMLTSAVHLSREDLGTESPRMINKFNIDGVQVIALGVKYRQSMGTARRVWAFLWFIMLASPFLLFIRRVDLVYATSTPLTIGIPALLGRWLRGRRFVFEVRDCWPAVPIEMGVLRNGMLIRVARFLERTIYRNAEAIVAASPGMTELVSQIAPSGTRVVTVPNAADTDVFSPEMDGAAVRKQRGWDGFCVCLHAGAMGAANGLDCIVRAAEHFRGDSDLLFVLIGNGSEKQHLRAQRDRLGLTNLQILDGIPKCELVHVLSAADICLVTFAPVPILEHNSANKFFDCLSAGKPVLLNYSGWQRRVIETAGAGLGCAMGDDEAFFANLATLGSDQARRSTMGRDARKLALEQFNRDTLAADVLSVIVDTQR